jgi:hypothetical protein
MTGVKRHEECMYKGYRLRVGLCRVTGGLSSQVFIETRISKHDLPIHFSRKSQPYLNTDLSHEKVSKLGQKNRTESGAMAMAYGLV